MIFVRCFILFFVLTLLTACGGNNGAQISMMSNSAPTISGGLSEIRVGEELNFTAESNDADGDILSFSIQGKPAWAEFNSYSGKLSGVPPEEDLASVYQIKISVSDGKASDSVTFDLTVTKPIFFLSIKVDTLDMYRNMDVELGACFLMQDQGECYESEEIMTINDNGVFRFEGGIEGGSGFSLDVERDPGRQECSLAVEGGVMNYIDETIMLTCQADASASLFALDRLHEVRLTMTINEWDAFVLDIARSNYETDAHRESGKARSSQVYRQVDFEYLDHQDNIIQRLDSVGFKMKGSTSRQLPEYIFGDADGQKYVKPKRFSFSLKFDEEFDEDESLYSCIDIAAYPAKVPGFPCDNRKGRDIDEVAENNGREFMGLEKLIFRFNRHDPSYQRELLAHDILNSIGVPTSRVAHANVVLRLIGEGSFNGQNLPQDFRLGVFQMVEPIDKPFLKRFFGKNGFLFKNGYFAYLAESFESITNCVVYGETPRFIDNNFCRIGVEKSDPDSREEWLGLENYLNPGFVNSDINGVGENSQFKPYQPRYALKSKKSKISDGASLLQDFIQFIQTYPGSEMLGEQFDVPGFIKAQAAEIVLGAADHYAKVGNNYYLYLNPLTNKWHYIPTDFDIVFIDTLSNAPDIYRDLASTLALPSGEKTHWVSSLLGSNADPILWNVVFSDTSNRNLLYREIKSILDDQVNWKFVGAKLDQRNTLVEAAINETEAGLPDGCGFIYNPDAINADGNSTLCDDNEISIKQFIKLRRTSLYQELVEQGL